MEFAPKDVPWNLQTPSSYRGIQHRVGSSLSMGTFLLSPRLSVISYLTFLTGVHSCLNHIPSKSNLKDRRGWHLGNLGIDVFS